MKKTNLKNSSLLEKHAEGDPIKAGATLMIIANALKACRDDLRGFKPALIDALRRIIDGEDPGKVLGLVRPPHRPKDEFLEMRAREIAMQYYSRELQDLKEEWTAKSIAQFWGLKSERHVRRIAKPYREWALREIALMGGEYKPTVEQQEFRNNLRRLLKERKDRN